MIFPRFLAGFAPKIRERRAAARRRPRTLALEPLEPRLALAAAGLVPVGVQPDGALAGKIAYVMGGHGYTTYMNDTTGAPQFWSFQRDPQLGMDEDTGNQEQMTAFADYLFRAGATVVPMRPIGYQPLEIVMDNDDAGVTFTGAWTNGTESRYFGSPGDVRYKYAAISSTETATAKYTPTITQAGYYPVYAWTPAGTDRVSDQLYRINHSGGSTEVTVNHRRVGTGLVYLGTYYFEAGTSGSVEISNRSSEMATRGNPKYVVADMIRFGNGMGSTDHGLGISGRTREDEPALYWIQWHAEHAQGVPSSAYRSSSDDDNATVAASPKYSTFMNQGSDGSLADRVLVSFHSNAAGGRGVTGLHNTSHGGDTPNQVLLARTLAQEVNNDLVAQNGQYEYNWSDRGTNVLYESPDFNYGELNNAYINNEFDATIIEVAFHDNASDAALMRDPRVRDAVGRATYQGLVKYFNAVDGGATSLTMLPGKVPQVRAETIDADSVQLTWTAPAANVYNGDAATGYRIYGSTNGYGFDGGTYVDGGATTTFTIDGLSAAEGAYFFKVVAVNAGGEGVASEVVAATPGDFTSKVLIVNGFDRLGRTQNPKDSEAGLPFDRVRPRYSNSYDYAVQFAAAVEASGARVLVDSTSNEFVISGAVDLADYDAVLWISGEESTADDTFNAAEQTLVANYLNAGGKLFASGAEIGWDLDSQGGGASFYNNSLKADYVADDAGGYAASGAAGSIFQGLSLTFDNGSQFYDVDFPDRIAAFGGSTLAMSYTAPGSGGAAVQFSHPTNGSKVVNFGFPFETITSAANRAAVMDRVLRYFIADADFNASGLVDGADFLAWQRGFGAANAGLSSGDADGDRTVGDADLAVWRSQFGSSSLLASAAQPAASAAIVSDSAGAGWPAANRLAGFTFAPSFLAGDSSGQRASRSPTPAANKLPNLDASPTPRSSAASEAVADGTPGAKWRRRHDVFRPLGAAPDDACDAAAVDVALGQWMRSMGRGVAD
jgi:hypothetical protein